MKVISNICSMFIIEQGRIHDYQGAQAVKTAASLFQGFHNILTTINHIFQRFLHTWHGPTG